MTKKAFPDIRTKYKKSCSFLYDLFNRNVLVYKPVYKQEETRLPPDPWMLQVINKLETTNRMVYAILESPHTYDFLYYLFNTDTNKPDNKERMKFEVGTEKYEDFSNLFLICPSYSILKINNSKDVGKVRVAPVVHSNRIESLRRIDNDEYWDLTTKLYLNQFRE